jgi:hypothetical protein
VCGRRKVGGIYLLPEVTDDDDDDDDDEFHFYCNIRYGGYIVQQL